MQRVELVMSKKLVVSVIIVTLCYTIICLLLYRNMDFKIDTKGGLKTNGLSYTCENNNGVSEFSYSVNLTNTNGKSIFIKTIELSMNEVFSKAILSKETVVAVHRDIKPNETIAISGVITINMKELSAIDIGKLVRDIKVSTEEIVSLK